MFHIPASIRMIRCLKFQSPTKRCPIKSLKRNVIWLLRNQAGRILVPWSTFEFTQCKRAFDIECTDLPKRKQRGRKSEESYRNKPRSHKDCFFFFSCLCFPCFLLHRGMGVFGPSSVTLRWLSIDVGCLLLGFFWGSKNGGVVLRKLWTFIIW